MQLMQNTFTSRLFNKWMNYLWQSSGLRIGFSILQRSFALLLLLEVGQRAIWNIHGPPLEMYCTLYICKLQGTAVQCSLGIAKSTALLDVKVLLGAYCCSKDREVPPDLPPAPLLPLYCLSTGSPPLLLLVTIDYYKLALPWYLSCHSFTRLD